VNPEKWAEWRPASTSPDGRWVEIVSYFITDDVPYSNLLKIEEFLLCLSGSNAPTVRSAHLHEQFADE
jgi:hypothetical protein